MVSSGPAIGSGSRHLARLGRRRAGGGSRMPAHQSLGRTRLAGRRLPLHREGCPVSRDSRWLTMPRSCCLSGQPSESCGRPSRTRGAHHDRTTPAGLDQPRPSAWGQALYAFLVEKGNRSGSVTCKFGFTAGTPRPAGSSARRLRRLARSRPSRASRLLRPRCPARTLGWRIR